MDFYDKWFRICIEAENVASEVLDCDEAKSELSADEIRSILEETGDDQFVYVTDNKEIKSLDEYRIYADYFFTVDCGTIRAKNKEDAIVKAHEKLVSSNYPLCCQCEEEMLDTPTLCRDGVVADLEVQNE